LGVYVTRGVRVDRVYRGTSATALELEGKTLSLNVGDVILNMNDRPVPSHSELMKILGDLPRGAPFTLTVIDRVTGKPIKLSGHLDRGGSQRLGVYIRKVR
jgi:S1-C subfamily serine protease